MYALDGCGGGSRIRSKRNLPMPTLTLYSDPLLELQSRSRYPIGFKLHSCVSPTGHNFWDG